VLALCQQRSGHAQAPTRALITGVADVLIPAALVEVQSVARQLADGGIEAETLTQERATLESLSALAPGCNVLHLACHGLFRADNPMFSGIRLGASSYLTLYDLYGLKLPAEMVVLSACVTGVNVIAAGDELLGLARGLFRAGAASLLLTLWEVPDQSTAEFMKAFYDRVFTTPNRASALREAVLAIREQYPHPIYWAPFVLMGKALAT